jgi:hypothetical protein
MDHSVGIRRAAAQAFQVLERTAMNLSSRRRQRLGSGIRPGETEHLVPRLE